jgi:hypothetical protein
MLAYEDLDLEEKLNRNYYTFRGFIFPNKDWLQMPQEVQEILGQINVNLLEIPNEVVLSLYKCEIYFKYRFVR